MPMQDFAYSLTEVHTNAAFCLFVDPSTYQCSTLPIRWPKYILLHAFACSLTQIHTKAEFCLFFDRSTYQCMLLPIRWLKYIPKQFFAYSLTEVRTYACSCLFADSSSLHTNAAFCLFVDWSTYQCMLLPVRWVKYIPMQDCAYSLTELHSNAGFSHALTEVPAVSRLLL